MTTSKSLQIGNIRIDRILEMEAPFMGPTEAFLDATTADVEAHRHWLEPHALCAQSGKLILAIQAYLIRTSRHTILIDTCVGCDKSNEWFAPWHSAPTLSGWAGSPRRG